jgi:hypothetical protein
VFPVVPTEPVEPRVARRLANLLDILLVDFPAEAFEQPATIQGQEAKPSEFPGLSEQKRLQVFQLLA